MGTQVSGACKVAEGWGDVRIFEGAFGAVSLVIGGRCAAAADETMLYPVEFACAGS